MPDTLNNSARLLQRRAFPTEPNPHCYAVSDSFPNWANHVARAAATYLTGTSHEQTTNVQLQGKLGCIKDLFT